MIFNNNTAQQTAELLLQINAIKLNSKNPFTWASGWKSPIYCDNRIILSFPAVRNYVRDEFAKHIEEKFGKPDVIAGVATGAIGIGILTEAVLPVLITMLVLGVFFAIRFINTISALLASVARLALP